MVDDISKATELLQDRKIFSVNVIDCEQNAADKKVKAIVIVFNDGYTEVRCPIKQDICSCPYGNRDLPIRKKRNGLLIRIFVRIIIVELILYPLVIAAIHLFEG